MDFGENSHGSKRKSSPSSALPSKKKFKFPDSKDYSLDVEDLTKVFTCPVINEHYSDEELKVGHESACDPFLYGSGINELENDLNVDRYSSGINELESDSNVDRGLSGRYMKKIEFREPSESGKNECRLKPDYQADSFKSIEREYIYVSDDDDHEPNDISKDNNHEEKELRSNDQNEDILESDDISECSSDEDESKISDQNHDRLKPEDISKGSSEDEKLKSSDHTLNGDGFEPEDISECSRFPFDIEDEELKITLQNNGRFEQEDNSECSSYLSSSVEEDFELSDETDLDQSVYRSEHGHMTESIATPCLVIKDSGGNVYEALKISELLDGHYCVNLPMVYKILQNVDCQVQIDNANQEFILTKYGQEPELYEQVLSMLKQELDNMQDYANAERACAHSDFDVDVYGIDWNETFVQEECTKDESMVFSDSDEEVFEEVTELEGQQEFEGGNEQNCDRVEEEIVKQVGEGSMQLESENKETQVDRGEMDDESRSSFSSIELCEDNPVNYDSSIISCKIHNLLERIFEKRLDHQHCPVKHISKKPDDSSQLHGKPIYKIISGKLQPPIYPSVKNNDISSIISSSDPSTSKSCDISREFQPPVLDPMNDNLYDSIDTAYNCYRKRKFCQANRKLYKLKDEFPIESVDLTLPDMCTDSFKADAFSGMKDQNLHHLWSKIASDFKAPSFAHLNKQIWLQDTVYEFDISSKTEIAAYNKETDSFKIIYLPGEEQMTIKWLLEETSDDNGMVQQDADMKILISLFLEISQDSEQKNVLHKVPVLQRVFEFFDAINSQENDLPFTKLKSKIIKKDSEFLFATIGHKTLLPLKLKLNACMHLEQFIQTLVGLSYKEAETQIVNSYKYGYLYSKLQNYFLATRDCRYAHFPDITSEQIFGFNFSGFKHEIERCPLYKVIVPKSAIGFGKTHINKSYRIYCYKKEVKEYLSKVKKIKNWEFMPFVDQLSIIRSSSVPKSIQFNST